MVPIIANEQMRKTMIVMCTTKMKIVDIMAIINLEETIDNEAMIGHVMEITKETMIEMIVGGKAIGIETIVGETGMITVKLRIMTLMEVIRMIEGTDLEETEMIIEVEEVAVTIETEMVMIMEVEEVAVMEEIEMVIVIMIIMILKTGDAEEMVNLKMATIKMNQRRERFIFHNYVIKNGNITDVQCMYKRIR